MIETIVAGVLDWGLTLLVLYLVYTYVFKPIAEKRGWL